jgi:hypothetical protein
MNNSNYHEMQIQQILPDGSQEWTCPTCGRHFILHFPPNFELEVLADGDQGVSHTGGTGGLQMGSTEITQTHQDAESPASGNDDDSYMDPWASWLKGKNF